MRRKVVAIFLGMILTVFLFGCKSSETGQDNVSLKSQDNVSEKTGLMIEEETVSESSVDIVKVDYIQEATKNDQDGVKVWGDLAVEDNKIDEINGLLQTYGKTVSFKAVSIDGLNCLSYNSEAEFFAASTIKAPYTLYCYMQMEDGHGKLEDDMVYTTNFYQTGSGSIKNSSNGTIFSAEDVLYKVMQESDNSGYLMCVNRWGESGYNSYMESIGCGRLQFQSGNVWVDQVRAEDFVVVWNVFYQYFLRNTELSEKLYRSCISPKVDFFGDSLSGSVVAQKYGISTTKDVYGNAAIVYGENNTYLLSIFTQSKGETIDKQFVKEVTGKIHEIMNQ